MTFIKVIILVLVFAVLGCAQQFAPKALVWEYDFTPYPDSSVHVIMYTYAEGIDTGFYAIDTTEANALEWDLISQSALYNFQWRQFFATAIEKGMVNDTTYWSFESAPSDTVREFFRALPPDPIGKSKLKYVYIKIPKL